MGFNEFEEKIVEFFKDYYKDTAKITVKDVMKNNGTILRGITVDFTGVNISPTIYLDDLYKDYKKCGEFDMFCKKAATEVDKAAIDHDVDISFIKSYDTMKERVLCKLINTKRNAEYLKNVPHVDFLDLSVVFYCIISNNAFGSGTIVITNDYFNLWNVKLETLFEDAKKNTRLLLESRIENIEDVVFSLLKERHKLSSEEAEDILSSFKHTKQASMYVLTNKVKTLGASCMLDKQSLYDFSKRIDSDFYILPCSVHEIILLPVSVGYNPNDLAWMVKEINATEVNRTDYLSNSIYRFNQNTMNVEIA